MVPSSFPAVLVTQLAQWSAALEVAEPSDEGWTVAGPLPVALSATLEVNVGPWCHEFDADDALEILDLLAAALFGRARVVAYAHRGAPAGHRLEIEVDGRWLDAGGRAPRRRLLRAPTSKVLINERPAPKGLSWGTPGRLPGAPWVGMLADAAPGPGELPIDGELDLHPFKPKEVRGVVEAYIDACLERGLTELRLVHGKGVGNLRRTVHALLERHPGVAAFRLGGMGEGSWGATVVTLHPPDRGA
ncbi:MAG: Smr/MutS family protein [Nannocystaceae bacterium]|nr:Smr/MutS family protein [bacterium]